MKKEKEENRNNYVTNSLTLMPQMARRSEVRTAGL